MIHHSCYTITFITYRLTNQLCCCHFQNTMCRLTLMRYISHYQLDQVHCYICYHLQNLHLAIYSVDCTFSCQICTCKSFSVRQTAEHFRQVKFFVVDNATSHELPLNQCDLRSCDIAYDCDFSWYMITCDFDTVLYL